MKGKNKLNFRNLTKVVDPNLDALLIYGYESTEKKNRLLIFYKKGGEMESYYDLRSVISEEQAEKIADWIEEFHPERFNASEVGL